MNQTGQAVNQARAEKLNWWNLSFRDAVAIATAGLILFIATGSFVLSYFSLYQTAIQYGLPPHLGWIWPLLIDFALIVFSLAVVRASLYGERTLWPWLMVALYTIATVTFNILHASDSLTARVVAVVAPVSLFLSFETLMAMLKAEAKRRGVRSTLQEMDQEAHRLKVQLELAKGQLEEVTAQLESTTGELSRVTGDLDQVNQEMSDRLDQVAQLEAQAGELMDQVMSLEAQKARAAAVSQPAYRPEPPVSQVSSNGSHLDSSLTERQERLLELLGQNLTQGQMADELGVSLSTIKRELAGLNGRAEQARI